jgi:hypothetical protein
MNIYPFTYMRILTVSYFFPLDFPALFLSIMALWATEGPLVEVNKDNVVVIIKSG